MRPIRLIFRNERTVTERYVGLTLVLFSWRLSVAFTSA